ncbi:phosphatidylinositol mannoside acyltransferase [Haloechinothrix halophila]|uniref:phosphatidylinositol mannoside acyltransferase n=1 Tax=Haloechinothrix halophila TaxID=1069073 RepID=UPI000405D267|nr:phosphatidylinositol mannoside acyltransferase [Haloechinothrix halophila]
MSRTADLLSDAGFGAGWRLVRLLPAKMADALFAAGGDIAAVRGGNGVAQLRRNLRRVVPQADDDELDELTKKAMRSYARYWQEAFRLPSMNHGTLADRFESGVEGKENLDVALRDGNGAILALPHSGNWDAAGVWLVNRYGRFTTVAERLKPESLYQRFVNYRESLGFEILPLTGGARALPLLKSRLRDNGIVCLLADRDLTSAGIPVTFFGEPTRMPAGPAWLAARTGAALLPLTTWFTEDGWGLRIHPRVRVNDREEIASATQHVADAFAGDIAAHPADWHMLQKLWLADLDEARRQDLDTADAGDP